MLTQSMLSTWSSLSPKTPLQPRLLVFTPLWGPSSFFFFLFLGPHLGHMEVPRLGINCSCSCQPYTTATATRDPSHVCDLRHSSWQCQILDPLSKARDWTCNLKGPSRIRFRCATMGTPRSLFLFVVVVYFFPLYSMGTKLHMHVYILFPPIVVLWYKYLDIVLNASQQDLIVNPFQEQ